MSGIPTLIISSEASAPAERAYTYGTVFGRFLGIPWRWERQERAGGYQTIRCEGEPGSVEIPDCFFALADADWLRAPIIRAEAVPVQWLSTLGDDGAPPTAPLPFGVHSALTAMQDGRSRLSGDVFGSTFFVLTSIEEALVAERDRHDRLISSASWLGRHNLLGRAVVDEWTDSLWRVLSATWPQLRRRPQACTTHITCDVDNPYSHYVGHPITALRTSAGDLLKRRSLRRSLRTLGNLALSSVGLYGLDPNHTFEWLMDENERRGTSVTFYFIAGGTQPGIDGFADLDTSRIRRILADIHRRGHRIGLHGSYHTFRDSDRLRREADRLRGVVASAGVTLERLPARQHYLRWDALSTPAVLEAAGIDEDSSVAFADTPGFRAGTCQPYALYDLRARRETSVLELPLALMDTTLQSPDYLGLTPLDALQRARKIIDVAWRHGGTLTLLWHNDSFQTSADRELYMAVLDAISGGQA